MTYIAALRNIEEVNRVSIVKRKKCNVLFIVNSLCFGGAEKHVVTLLNSLDISSFNLSLAYLKDDTSLLGQIDISRLNTLFCCNVRKKVDLNAVDIISSCIDKFDIDVVISTNEYPMIYSFLAKKKAIKKTDLMVVFHTTIQTGIKSYLKMKLYKYLFKKQKKLIYVCEAQKNYWTDRGLESQCELVIHNGIDPNYFLDNISYVEKQNIRKTYSIAKDDFLIGICAALRPEKSHIDLLKAISLLNQASVPVKLLIIGDGNERSKIERFINQLKLNNIVTITGFQKDVRMLVAACDVMALVSHSETFSISTLEAMSLGKPIVMSDIGGAKEQVEHGYNGYIFPAGNIEKLAEGLGNMNSKTKQQEFGKRSREVVLNRYTEKIMADNYKRALLVKNL